MMVLGFLRKSLNLSIGETNLRIRQESEAISSLRKKCKNKTVVQVLQDEITEWLESGEETAKIELDRISENDRKLYFSLGEEGSFEIQFPADYPFTKELFDISSPSPSLQHWVAEMASFVKDSCGAAREAEPPIFLSRLLSRAAEKYLELSPEEIQSEEEFDFETEKGTTDDFDLQSKQFNHSLEVLALKKRWSKREVQIRDQMVKEEQAKTKKKSYTQIDVIPNTSQKKVDQIFTSNAASGVLTNDLLTIMEQTKELGFSAEPVDDNIYHWRVKLFGFDQECKLGKQLQQIKQKYGYDFVELDVSFTFDLYPFYPPLVKLVRPRFHGFMMGRVTCMDLLKLSHWDPVKDMRFVLTEIRNMVREIGKLDSDNLFNDVGMFPEGAYTELEYLLLRLELLSEQQSRAASRFADERAKRKINEEQLKKMEEKEEVIQIKKKKEDTKDSQKEKEKKKVKEIFPTSPSSTYWAKGTGYGHSNYQKSQWDVQAYLAAQREKDSQTEEVLQGIFNFFNKVVLPPGQFEILEESCLIPVLESYLRNDSLLDMGRHTSLYIVILGVVRGMSRHKSLVALLDSLPLQSTPICELLKKIQIQASIFMKRVSLDESLEFELAKDIITIYEEMDQNLKEYKKVKREQEKILKEQKILEETKELNIMDKEEETSKQLLTEGNMEKVIDELNSKKEEVNKEETKMVPGKQEEGENDEDLLKEYERCLQHQQFDTVSMKDLRGNYVHHYNNYEPSSTILREKVFRLAQEQGSLATSLPLNLSSSVFVKVDEERMDMMQALITGPCDTPYDSGCFQFDIYFSQQYPNTAPLVNLQTTGGGSVRFNPNLYNCGKVCLSLLGTWSGADGENWNKDTSTILQVLVSIQSLIFVPQPYFNEPGYERQINTKAGDDASKKYNEVIRLATVEYAMLNQLRNPNPGFESVIRAHFYLKRRKVLRQVENWLEEGKGSSNHYSRLKRAYDDLKSELEKLEPST